MHSALINAQYKLIFYLTYYFILFSKFLDEEFDACEPEQLCSGRSEERTYVRISSNNLQHFCSNEGMLQRDLCCSVYSSEQFFAFFALSVHYFDQISREVLTPR